MFKFLDRLGKIARYDIEIFKCSLGVRIRLPECPVEEAILLQAGWSVPVEVIVGPEMGVSYVTDSRCSVSFLSWLHRSVNT